VEPGGRVDVAYYDRSRDPGDVLADVVIASSANGGSTFTTATLTDAPFDSMVGSFNGDDVMLGSHLAVASGADGATIIWADAARGNRVNNIVDLVSGTVAVRSGAGARVPLVGAGVLVMVLGLALTARSSSGSAAGRGHRPARPPAAWPRPGRRD
jgi:hypothetical protein